MQARKEFTVNNLSITACEIILPKQQGVIPRH